MTIQDIGSLGELVAAVATVATLAYLSLQIRQNSRANQLIAIARMGQAAEQWLGQIVQDEKLYEIYRAGILDSESLSREERGRFDLLVVQLLRSVETGWLQQKWGLVDPDYWDGFMHSVKVVVGSEGGRRAFARNRDVFAPEFREVVETAIENQGPREAA